MKLSKTSWRSPSNKVIHDLVVGDITYNYNFSTEKYNYYLLIDIVKTPKGDYVTTWYSFSANKLFQDTHEQRWFSTETFSIIRNGEDLGQD